MSEQISLIPLSKAAPQIRPDLTPNSAYQWLWRNVRDGHVTATKIGSRYYVTRSQIDKALNSGTSENA